MSHYHIKSFEEYFYVYNKSVKEPERFWEEIAEEHFVWRKRWDKVLEWDFKKPEIKWFDGAQLNISENCIDRHLSLRGNQTAILFEPNDPKEPSQHISYKELHKNVCKMANVLKGMGVKKGDRVCIYLPMIPEIAYAVLACARIGAIHSVVFAGFSSTALSTRINDCEATFVITSDGSYRGNKVIDLKGIVDKALEDCSTIKKVLVVERIKSKCNIVKDRDELLTLLFEKASDNCPIEVMEAEDPLFILYTSGSTGKPKGMLHTTAGYMVYTSYTFKNVFQYHDKDIYWCSADIGWITGHSYILYGPLVNGATTLIFEGIPTYPNYSRFWDVIEKHKVNQFYTAPTALRALAQKGISPVEGKDLSSLKILGTVGEPINEDAWHWYNDNIGNKKCPIVDTWWQTETGGILISPLPFITPLKPTYATLPFPGIRPVLLNDQGNEIKENQTQGKLCIKFPWPSIARTIWGDHNRYKETYFSAYKNKYFTGDGAIRDEAGYYRIIGRVDDVVIVSGHNLGTAPIEDAINLHPAITESAVVGFPHDIKGNALYGYIILSDAGEGRQHDNLRKEINQTITEHIGPIAKLDKIQFVSDLPKTRSGKIMRRILRKIASKDFGNFGDTTTLLNPDIIDKIKANTL